MLLPLLKLLLLQEVLDSLVVRRRYTGDGGDLAADHEALGFRRVGTVVNGALEDRNRAIGRDRHSKAQLVRAVQLFGQFELGKRHCEINRVAVDRRVSVEQLCLCDALVVNLLDALVVFLDLLRVRVVQRERRIPIVRMVLLSFVSGLARRTFHLRSAVGRLVCVLTRRRGRGYRGCIVAWHRRSRLCRGCGRSRQEGGRAFLGDRAGGGASAVRAVLF